MKSRYILMSVAAAAMTFVSCVKENVVDQTFSEVTLNAVTETGQTKTALTGFADVVWAAGDKIAVYDGAAFTDFTLSSGAGTASAAFSGTLAESKTATAAVYPASAKGTGMTTVKYPTEYAYSEMGVNAPMVASVADGVLQFKHVGGVVKFDVGNIPPTAAGFVFTANSKITGDFTVTEGAVATSGTTPESVKITFTPASMKSAVFMVPLPTGTYTGFSVKFVDGSGDDIAGTAKVKDTYSFTIDRKQLLAFPAFVDKTTGGNTVLWDDEMLFDGWEDQLGFESLPTLVEGDVIRLHYKDATDDAQFALKTLDYASEYNGWLKLTPGASVYEVVMTESLANAINDGGGFRIQGFTFTITKLEVSSLPNPETVLWTGELNATGFTWLAGTFSTEIVKPGSVLRFYMDAIEEWGNVYVGNDYDWESVMPAVQKYAGTTCIDVEITQDILDKITSNNIRLAVQNFVLRKVTIQLP